LCYCSGKDVAPKCRKKTSVHLEKYKLLDGCGPCRLRCYDRITDESREQINKHYWQGSFGERRVWLDGHINIYSVKRRRHPHSRSHSRQHSLTYTLPQGTGKTPVCKKMFMRTLGLKTDAVITEFIRAKQRKADDISAPAVTTDRRGKASPPNKIEHNVIREHINSFHPQISHYNIAHAPHRRYLESSLSVTSE